MRKNLWNKTKESLFAVLPITLIIVLISFTLIKIDTNTLALFLSGAFLLIIGMGLFTLGADMAMIPMGEGIGAKLSESKKIWLIIPICFLMGFLITIAEPDLQVFASQFTAVPKVVMILSFAGGIGVFLVIFLIKTFLKIKLSYVLILLYGIIFTVAIFVPKEFLAIAFDSGGVSTGPVSAPFIMALGIGLAAVRGGKSSREDSFGMLGMSSIGAILAVLLIGLFYKPESMFSVPPLESVHGAAAILKLYITSWPHYMLDVLMALSPVLVAFAIFQIFALKLPKKVLIKLIIGIIYAFFGLSLFLLAVNVGFMPAGRFIGSALAATPYKWVLLPLGMVLGFVIILAEPAIQILTNQVEDLTGGAISKKLMVIALTVGVAFAVGISMLRVLTGISIWFFILPGYIIALTLTFVVPPIFTAIAFDSGSVATGPMSVAFLLPFAMGASAALSGNVLTDAFGVVAMVAMMPLLTVQIIGLIYTLKLKKKEKRKNIVITDNESENEIIHFDEETKVKQ